MKPKPFVKKIFSASEIKSFINKKYKNNGKEFWKLFLSETEWGDTNLIDFDDHPFEESYVSILKKEFSSYLDEDGFLEIENDI
jgi:hypothetical protein